MYKLKAAPKKEAKPTTKAIKPNIESELIKIKISPAKLGVGGAAILATLNKNHHKDNKGAIVNPLRNSSILREESRS